MVSFSEYLSSMRDLGLTDLQILKCHYFNVEHYDIIREVVKATEAERRALAVVTIDEEGNEEHDVPDITDAHCQAWVVGNLDEYLAWYDIARGHWIDSWKEHFDLASARAWVAAAKEHSTPISPYRAWELRREGVTPETLGPYVAKEKAEADAMLLAASEKKKAVKAIAAAEKKAAKAQAELEKLKASIA